MGKYKSLVTVDAYKTPDVGQSVTNEFREWMASHGLACFIGEVDITVQLPNVKATCDVRRGDWIVVQDHGKFSTYAPGEFANMYEAV